MFEGLDYKSILPLEMKPCEWNAYFPTARTVEKQYTKQNYSTLQLWFVQTSPEMNRLLLLEVTNCIFISQVFVLFTKWNLPIKKVKCQSKSLSWSTDWKSVGRWNSPAKGLLHAWLVCRHSLTDFWKKLHNYYSDHVLVVNSIMFYSNWCWIYHIWTYKTECIWL